MVVAVVADGREWHALEDDVVVGRAHVLRRPDRRTFVAVDAWHAEAGTELLEAVVRQVPGELHSLVDEHDHAQLALLGTMGFTEVRREDEFVVPVTTGPAATPGFTVVSAADVELERLARLDERLRADVPGSDGWVNDLEEFREQTFGHRMFDPQTYLVAVAGDGTYAGLVRIWVIPRTPRLGLVGVLPPYRRRGLATALLRQAFRPLAERGVEQVTAEADAADAAAQALLAGLRARRTGGTVELRRSRRGAQPT